MKWFAILAFVIVAGCAPTTQVKDGENRSAIFLLNCFGFCAAGIAKSEAEFEAEVVKEKAKE